MKITAGQARENVESSRIDDLSDVYIQIQSISKTGDCSIDVKGISKRAVLELIELGYSVRQSIICDSVFTIRW